MSDSSQYPYIESTDSTSTIADSVNVASSSNGENASVTAKTASRSSSRKSKNSGAFMTIREVADKLSLQQHVLRFWETKFTQVKPLKRGGGRRYYRPEDVVLLKNIQHLLHTEGYTIKGVQKFLRSEGKKTLSTELLSERDQSTHVPVGDNEPNEVTISKKTSDMMALLEELKILRDIVSRV